MAADPAGPEEPDLSPRSTGLDDVQLEQDVLGACFVNPVAFSEVKRWLDPQDFHGADTRTVWRACLAMVEGGMPAPTHDPLPQVLIEQRLEEQEAYRLALDVRTQWSILSSENFDPWGGVTFAAQKLARLAQARRVVSAGSQIANLGYDLAEDPGAKAEHAHALLAEATFVRGASPIHPLSDYLSEYFDALQGDDDVRASIALGLGDLDRITGGLRPGELTVLAARTAHGKTALACQIGHHAATHAVPVLYVALEEGGLDLTCRLIALEAGLPYTNVREGRRLSEEEIDRAVAACGTLGRPTWHFLRPDRATVPALRDHVIRSANVGLAGLVVVDYLQLLAPGRRTENQSVRIGAVAQELKLLAEEAHVPILALAQLNRQVEARSGHEPNLADLRESGGIEQAADAVWLMWQPRLFDRTESDEALVIVDVAKNRHGSPGRAALQFRVDQTRYYGRESDRTF